MLESAINFGDDVNNMCYMGPNLRVKEMACLQEWSRKNGIPKNVNVFGSCVEKEGTSS